MNIKNYILTQLQDVNSKIRLIEEIGTSNNSDISNDSAYIILVARRSVLRDILEYLEGNNATTISRFS